MKTHFIAIAAGLAIFGTAASAQTLSALPSAPVETPAPAAKVPANAVPSTNQTNSAAKRATPSVAQSKSAAKIPRAKLAPPSRVTQDFYRAVVAGNVELADILLQKGADINCANCDGAPLLHWALSDIIIGHPKFPNAVNWLFDRKANANVQAMPSGETALHLVIGQSLEFSKWSPLDGFYVLIRTLMDQGANPNLQDQKGWTAMHYAGRFLHLPIDAKASQFAQRILRDFASAGAQVNRQDRAGNSPLTASMIPGLAGWTSCNTEIARTFLEVGADPTLKNAKGQNAQTIAYELAVNHGKECNPLMKLLDSGYSSIPTAASKPSRKQPAVSLPSAIAGEYVGVLRMKTPSVMTVAVSGTLNADGSVSLNAPRGVTTVGFVSRAEGDAINLRLKTRAPEGFKFANGQRETDAFDVTGNIIERIYRGNYAAPTDSGEFILCPQDLANQRPECKPTFMETLNASVGWLLGQ